MSSIKIDDKIPRYFGFGPVKFVLSFKFVSFRYLMKLGTYVDLTEKVPAYIS